MKVLVVPDVHGSHKWEAAKTKINEVDFIVFLGDYFDSFNNKWPDQGENFKAICDFKRKYPNKVFILAGNHDFSYISGSHGGKNCSGHQFDKDTEIRAMLITNKDIIDLAFECDGWIFSHAGFSKTAVKEMLSIMHDIYTKYPKIDKESFDSEEDVESYFSQLYKNVKEWDPKEYSIDFLNKCWHERSHFLGDENFCLAFDEKLDWDGCFSMSGDEATQFCLWIRPHALLDDAYYPKQVVGHTELCPGNYVALKKDDNIVVLCDSRNHGIYGIFDTEKLPIEPITELEFQRNMSHLIKKINDIRSTFGVVGHETGKPVSKEEILKELVKAFGEIGNEYYELFFEKS